MQNKLVTQYKFDPDISYSPQDLVLIMDRLYLCKKCPVIKNGDQTLIMVPKLFNTEVIQYYTSETKNIIEILSEQIRLKYGSMIQVESDDVEDYWVRVTK